MSRTLLAILVDAARRDGRQLERIHAKEIYGPLSLGRDAHRTLYSRREWGWMAGPLGDVDGEQKKQ